MAHRLSIHERIKHTGEGASALDRGISRHACPYLATELESIDLERRQWWLSGWDARAVEIASLADANCFPGDGEPIILDALEHGETISNLFAAKKLTPREREVLQNAKARIGAALALMPASDAGAEQAGPAPASEATSERACRNCGCTEHHACTVPDPSSPTGYGACHWVEKDLCSGCASEVYAQSAQIGGSPAP